jgi:hypothetical protein
MKWYLKERYLRNLIRGNMIDKKSFINYKNNIMLHYIKSPQNWIANKKNKKKNN